MSGGSPNILSTASEIARRAGALLMEYFARGVKTEYKGAGTVDVVAENFTATTFERWGISLPDSWRKLRVHVCIPR